MPLIALGWCRDTAKVPDDLTLLGCGKVQVISVTRELCPTPRQKLGLLQACFEAGVDVIPLAPNQNCPADTAVSQAHACTADLLQQLTAITGFGQLSLTLSWPAKPAAVPVGGSGRAFLRALHGHSEIQATLAKAAGMAVRDLLAGLTAPHGPVISHPDGCRVDILVGRDRATATRQHIATVARSLTTLPGLSLMVTGLWPPLGFVRPPRPTEAVPA